MIRVCNSSIVIFRSTLLTWHYSCKRSDTFTVVPKLLSSVAPKLLSSVAPELLQSFALLSVSEVALLSCPEVVLLGYSEVSLLSYQEIAPLSYFLVFHKIAPIDLPSYPLQVSPFSYPLKYPSVTHPSVPS